MRILNKSVTVSPKEFSESQIPLTVFSCGNQRSSDRTVVARRQFFYLIGTSYRIKSTPCRIAKKFENREQQEGEAVWKIREWNICM